MATDSAMVPSAAWADRGAPPMQAGPESPGEADIAYPQLCLRSCGTKGRGVVAGRRFRCGEIVERAPVIVLPDPQWESLNQTLLTYYYYKWGPAAVAIAFGFGAFYNHSETPNIEAQRRLDAGVMEYVALRDIEVGEEISIRYDCPLWFTPEK